MANQHYIKKLLCDYNSIARFTSPEERSKKLKQYFMLSHGKGKKKGKVK